MRNITFKFYDNQRKRLMDVSQILEQGILVCEHRSQSFVCLIEHGTLIEFTGRTYETVDVYGGYLIQEISDDPRQNSLPLEVYWDDRKAGYMARSIDEEHLFTTPLPEDGYRVVGNIFEDTALVEEYKTLHKVLAGKE
jgi:hypothetical protein